MAIIRDYRQAGLAESEVAMFEFADKLTRTPYAMTKEDLQRLRQVGFSEVEVMDIILATAYRNFITRVVEAAGAELDPYLEKLDAEFLDVLDVKRDRPGAA
ncbi:MAG: hypothetical protein HYY85_21125 [Deltaproteobacteria bacterium]|nr:hypothetical protein [Deltaproteobacteria bacterium]